MSTNFVQQLLLMIGSRSQHQAIPEIQKFFLEWASGFAKPIGSAARKKKGAWLLSETVSVMGTALRESDTTLVAIYIATSPLFRMCMSRSHDASWRVQESIYSCAEKVAESCGISSGSAYLSYEPSGAAWIMARVKRSEWFDHGNPVLRMSILQEQKAFCQELRDIAEAYVTRKNLSEFFAFHSNAIGTFGIVDLGKSLNSLGALLDSGDLIDREYRFSVYERERDFRRVLEFFRIHTKARAEEFLHKNILEYIMEMQYDKKLQSTHETMKLLHVFRLFGIINRVPKKQVNALLECIADSRVARECQYQPQNLETVWINFLESALLRDWHPLCSEIMGEDTFRDLFTLKTLLRLWKP